MIRSGAHLRPLSQGPERCGASAGGTSISAAARKSQLRRSLRALRARLSRSYRQRAAQVAARRLLRSPLLARARRVAAYLAYGSEIDPQPLIEALAARGCTILVPRVDVRKRGCMRFVELRTGTRRTTSNRYGIAEPTRARAGAGRIDVAILPLVGFDRHGHRLGSGAGYYDRWIAGLRGRRPKLVGLAFAVQEVDEVPSEPWDVRLDFVCTERKLGRSEFPRTAGLSATVAGGIRGN